MTGGSGADTFRFELQVNAKDEIVAKHVNGDGTIDWVGVTGENNATHDHWVDGFGNDVIRDFNRAQGDKIEISAHTGEVQSIVHKDSNGDGRNDYSVITVISQQGNAGAHDEDLLGTITVYGNLVKQSDIVTDQTVYGAYEKVDLLGRRRPLPTGRRRRAGRWRHRRRPPQRSDRHGQHAHVSQQQQDTITDKGRLPALVLQRPVPIHSSPGAEVRFAAGRADRLIIRISYLRRELSWVPSASFCAPLLFRRDNCTSCVVLSVEPLGPRLTRRSGSDSVCDVGFAGGPWNEPALTFAVVFFHDSRPRPLLDGCDRADQP